MMAEQQGDSCDQSNLLSLKWNNHLSNFKVIIASLQEKSVLSDATLACDGQLFPVHKLVLSTCSEFFGRVFSSTPCKHPVIVLHDLQPQHLHYLLSYMYVGEVNVPQAHLPTLIRAAETLQIKGLAAPDEEPSPALDSSQTGLTNINQNRKDLFSTFQNTGQDLCNKSSANNKSSAKKRRCFSVDDQRNAFDDQSNNLDEDNNTGDNLEKRLNLLNAKRSRKANDSLESGYIEDNHEQPSFQTDVKQEKSSNLSPLEQVVSIKEENEVGGSNDATGLEDGMGEWGDEHSAIKWTTSSSQHEMPVTALPWIPFSSPSSSSAQDSEATAGYPSSNPVSTAAASDTSASPDGDTNTASSALLSSPILAKLEKHSMIENSLKEKIIVKTSQLHSSEHLEGFSGFKGLCTKSVTSSFLIDELAEQESASNNSGSPSTSNHRGSSDNNLQSSSHCGDLVPLQTSGGSGGPCRQWLCPYPLCGYTTDRESWLKTHLRKHTGERPFQCPHCPYRSAQKSNLTVHVKKVHNKDKQRQRGGCSRSSLSYSSLEEGFGNRRNSFCSLVEDSNLSGFSSSIGDWGSGCRRKSVDNSDTLFGSSGKHPTLASNTDNPDSRVHNARNSLMNDANDGKAVKVNNGKSPANKSSYKNAIEHDSLILKGSPASLANNSSSNHPRNVGHSSLNTPLSTSSNFFSNGSGQTTLDLLDQSRLDGALLGLATPTQLEEQQQQHHLHQLLQHQLGLSHQHHLQEYHH